MIRITLKLCMFCLKGSMVFPVTAQVKRPMTMVDLVNVPSLSDPQVSPDGSQILYVRSEGDWEANKRIGHIWRGETGNTSGKSPPAMKKKKGKRWSLIRCQADENRVRRFWR